MAASTPAATCGPAGRGCASSPESSGILPDFPWAEPCEAKVRKVLLVLIGGGLLHGKRRHRVGLSLAGLRPLVLIGGELIYGKLGHRARLSLWQNAKKPRFCGVLLVLIGGGLLHGKCRHRVGLSLAALRPRVLIGGGLPPVGERGGGCSRKRALDASVARRAKAQRTGSERRPGRPTGTSSERAQAPTSDCLPAYFLHHRLGHRAAGW